MSSQLASINVVFPSNVTKDERMPRRESSFSACVPPTIPAVVLLHSRGQKSHFIENEYVHYLQSYVQSKAS